MSGDNPQRRGKECFPCGSQVSLQNGDINIEDLSVGDEARIIDDNGDVKLSTVYALSHKNLNVRAPYIQIDTRNKRLTISHRHHLPVKRGDDDKNIMAQDAQLGDILTVYDESLDGIGTEQITDIEVVERRGAYSPFTKQGTLIVDGVVVSCYAEVKPSIAHIALAPLRLLYDVTPTHLMETIMTPNEEGIPYILDKTFEWVKPLVAK